VHKSRNAKGDTGQHQEQDDDNDGDDVVLLHGCGLGMAPVYRCTCAVVDLTRRGVNASKALEWASRDSTALCLVGKDSS
jgi:hypothetical protein